MFRKKEKLVDFYLKGKIFKYLEGHFDYSEVKMVDFSLKGTKVILKTSFPLRNSTRCALGCYLLEGYEDEFGCEYVLDGERIVKKMLNM